MCAAPRRQASIASLRALAASVWHRSQRRCDQSLGLERLEQEALLHFRLGVPNIKHHPVDLAVDGRGAVQPDPDGKDTRQKRRFHGQAHAVVQLVGARPEPRATRRLGRAKRIGLPTFLSPLLSPLLSAVAAQRCKRARPTVAAARGCMHRGLQRGPALPCACTATCPACPCRRCLRPCCQNLRILADEEALGGNRER